MRRVCCILMLLLLVVTSLLAQRKKVAVVLGGGGAKGFAHVGVLKVLEEVEIPVDYVVGTSIGAIVGGLYAVGYDANTIDSLVRKQDWMMLLSDQLQRSSKSFPEKERSERYILSLPFGKEKKDRVISGAIKGRNLLNLFSDLTIGYHDSVDFNYFPIPYACVAVDVVSGKDYVFRSGSLPLAMRASMSIPAAFTPVRLDSMVLIDGGINNNYPVDVARQMGAEIIIGVDLATSDLKTLDEVNTPGDIIGQIIALHGHEKYQQNKEDTDLLLRPDVTPYNSASFGKPAIDTLIERGEQVARKRLDDILALKEKIGITPTYEAEDWRTKACLISPEDSFFVRNISFSGAFPGDEKWLLKVSGLKDNTSMTLHQLKNAISILMGTDVYSNVSYQLTGENPYNLELTVQPKSISSFNLGLRFDTEEIVAGLLNATFAHKGQNRSKFAFTGRIGTTSYARLDYALERTPLRGLNISYMFRYQNLDIFDKGEKTYNTTYTHHFSELAYSDMNWLNFKIKAGLRYEYFDYNSFLYTGENQKYSVIPEGYISYFLSTHLETLDGANFPTKGVSLQADYSLYTDNFVQYNGRSPFSAIKLSFMSVFPVTSHLSLIPSVYGRALIGGNLAYPYLNAIGGEVFGKYMPQQMPFAGVNQLELVDNLTGIVRLHVRQRIYQRHFVSLIGNYGVSHDDLLELFKGSNLWGASIGYAYNSMAGPLSANLSISNRNKKVLFYLNLGFNF
ncbi:patatin-like phospholipase family protein [Parabacteroides sp. PH5-46]|nr:patatin-like phospholipase family protein [Parabacteroides sp. PH5-46]MDH6347718.1 NTE family protein [Parabacteroides sp. PH5-46]